MSDAERVRFLVAGVQKGGTTALFSYLGEHPGVRMGEPKEVHYFDHDAIDWSRPDYAAYHAHFPAPDGRALGEATPIYIYWPNCLERIRAYNPGMRLILLFRDPIQRAWSQWRMEYARGAETEPFAWCIREGRRRLSEPDSPEPGFHRVFSYVERGFYGAQLERAHGLFPKSQVLALDSDDLRERPDPVLRTVCAFLGVESPTASVQPRRVFEGRSMDYGSTLTPADIAHLRQVYADDIATFRALSGLSTPGWSV